MLPLARYRAPSDPVLLYPGGAITATTFFSQVHHLAAALPDTRFVVNLCETRHGFMLGFAAALLRGQTSLLPSGQGRSDREQVLRQYPDAWLLSDKPLAAERVFDIGLFLVNSAAHAMQMPLVDDDQMAAILFTSGSTGQPSAHSKTWGQLCHGAASLAAALNWEEFPSCTIVGSVPPQHMFGLETTVMLPWATGIPVHAQKPLLPADVDNVLRQSDRSSWWMTTPMHLRAPLHALSGLAGVVASTMSLPASVARAAETAWQVPVMEIYGSTETGALAIRRTASENLWTPLTGVSLWLEGEGEGQKIWAAGPHVGPPVALGDELKLQPDGRFLWLGRSTDLIKVGGKRASLSALNQNLTDIPGVDDGAYFSPANDNTHASGNNSHPAQRMAAFYVSATLSPREVLKTLRASIDPVFLPRPLYRVAQLPRNANGKLPQAALVELFAQCHLQKAPHMMISAEHPALSGHFPNNPLIPGVVILARVAQAIRTAFPHMELDTLLNARFHAPLKPGNAFIIHPQLQDERVRFKVLLADSEVLIASGQWQCRATNSLQAGNA
ncbi:putative 4-coumarate--CoA ligase [Georgfuchsia toluolica]|uniref:4-coumarate--CoA ligase n=1 Tax=Georgfuchsia toluolica TaxID=424218 RepID=A0A916J4V8_9PROT|nr:AMP-binding protein [Georgfuchsia toluolica]CAG4883453.1 putative 4-coumarate--CoA ligase [Georgfuchsia toluolica]